MPIATAVGPALRTVCMIGPDPTAQADLQSAVDQAHALELELRGPDGAVIATEDIGIIDTHYLLELARAELPGDEDGALTPEEAAEIDALVEEWDADDEALEAALSTDEDTEFPRYQIQIYLVDHGAVP